MGPGRSRPDEVMQRECCRVFYSGRVQGVGFRYTASNVARGFDVAGYVRNLPDGRVELLAEGAPAEIDEFLRAIRESLDRYIRDASVEPCPPSSSPSEEFTIRYD
jgi:acylphosphatase